MRGSSGVSLRNERSVVVLLGRCVMPPMPNFARSLRVQSPEPVPPTGPGSSRTSAPAHQSSPNYERFGAAPVDPLNVRPAPSPKKAWATERDSPGKGGKGKARGKGRGRGAEWWGAADATWGCDQWDAAWDSSWADVWRSPSLPRPLVSAGGRQPSHESAGCDVEYARPPPPCGVIRVHRYLAFFSGLPLSGAGGSAATLGVGLRMTDGFHVAHSLCRSHRFSST